MDKQKEEAWQWSRGVLSEGVRPDQAPAGGGGGAGEVAALALAAAGAAAEAKSGRRAERISRRLGLGMSASDRSGRSVSGWVLPS